MRREDTGWIAFSTRVMTLAFRGQGVRIVCGVIAFSVVLWLGGCATMQKTFGGWFGAATPTPTPRSTSQAPAAAAAAPRVYYAGIDELKVYSEPSAASKVVGTLALHEKVTRTKLEHGYAYVESTKGAVKGWVMNKQLIWRLPTTSTTTGTPAPEAAEPEETAAPAGEEPPVPATPEATATAAEPLPTATSVPEATATPVPAAPRKSQATPGGVGPSIFDAY